MPQNNITLDEIAEFFREKDTVLQKKQACT